MNDSMHFGRCMRVDQRTLLGLILGVVMACAGSVGLAQSPGVDGITLRDQQGELQRYEQLHAQRPDDPAAQAGLAFALAAVHRWAEAARHFEQLYDRSDEPVWGFRAMRSWAAVREHERARILGQRVFERFDRLDPTARVEFRREYGTLLKMAGFELRRADQAYEAARVFAQAAEVAGARAELLANQGYAHLAAREPTLARQAFLQAIELDRGSSDTSHDTMVTEPAAPQSAAVQGREEGELAQRLRRELRELDKRWSVSVYQSWRAREQGPALGTIGLQRNGLVGSQGALELAWRASGEATEALRTELFARTLWSQRGTSLAIDDSSVQAGLGVRVQPWSASPLRVSAERLVAIGDQTQDDWLLRASWGWSSGEDEAATRAVAGRRVWPSARLYVDAGHFFRDGGTDAVFAEARAGLSSRWGEVWIVTPHVVVNGRGQRPDPSRVSWAEAGVGVSLRRFLREAAQDAARGQLEIGLQWKHAMSGSGRTGWVLVAGLLW